MSVAMSGSANKQRGFTLLEAIVALSVLAMSSMALYGWINSNLLLLKRVDDVYQSVEVVDSALEFISTLDPYLQPVGEQEIADTLVFWRFVPQGSSMIAKDMRGNVSVNDAQLFLAEVEIRRKEKILARFDVMQLGLQAKRTVEDVIF